MKKIIDNWSHIEGVVNLFKDEEYLDHYTRFLNLMSKTSPLTDEEDKEIMELADWFEEREKKFK